MKFGDIVVLVDGVTCSLTLLYEFILFHHITTIIFISIQHVHVYSSFVLIRVRFFSNSQNVIVCEYEEQYLAF